MSLFFLFSLELRIEFGKFSLVYIELVIRFAISIKLIRIILGKGQAEFLTSARVSIGVSHNCAEFKLS